MERGYPWYEIVDSHEDLLQGDFIKNCSILIPPSKVSHEAKVEVRVINYNVIIMRYSNINPWYN
jgi:hypothetical protein